MLGTVTVANISKLTTPISNSIFTFIDEKYKLYRLQVYQKEEGTSLAKISNKIAEGSWKILGYVYSRKNNTSKAKAIEKEEQKLDYLLNKTK